MSLNKFTDATSIKSYLNIGANSIKCRGYKAPPFTAQNSTFVTDGGGNLNLVPFSPTPDIKPVIQLFSNDTIVVTNNGASVPVANMYNSGSVFTKVGNHVQVSESGEYKIVASCVVKSSAGITNVLMRVTTDIGTQLIGSSVSFLAGDIGLSKYKTLYVTGLLHLNAGQEVYATLSSLNQGTTSITLNYRNLAVLKI